MPGPVAAAAITAGTNFAGGLWGNYQARKESARNRAFQEKMRNTQWQATIADMRKAGINPAVAYSKGPNVSPSGSMAAQDDPLASGVSSALQAAALESQIAETKSRTVANLASAGNLKASERRGIAEAILAELELKPARMETQVRTKRARYLAQGFVNLVNREGVRTSMPGYIAEWLTTLENKAENTRQARIVADLREAQKAGQLNQEEIQRMISEWPEFGRFLAQFLMALRGGSSNPF